MTAEALAPDLTESQRAADAAVEYVEHGFALVSIPAGTKGDHGMAAGWNLEQNAIRDPRRAAHLTGNIGLCHAWSRTCAVDVDEWHGAEAWMQSHGIDLAALCTDESAVQIRSGREGRAKLLYRLPDSVDWLPSMDCGTPIEGKHPLELRCATKEGKTVQDVLPPSIHPETGKPYQWVGDWRNLPELPEALLDLWIAEATPARGEHKPAGSFGETRVQGILGHIPNNDLPYSDWLRVGMAIHHATAGSGFHLWTQWSEQSGKHDPSLMERKWRSFSEGANPVTIGTLSWMASQHGYSEALADFNNLERTDTGTTDPVPAFDLESARVGDLIDSEPPEREWLVRDFLPLGVVGLLAAAGSTGKSMATLQLAIGVCTGLPWLGMPVDEDNAGPVLIFSTEDDRDEVHRRLSRVLKLYREELYPFTWLDGEWTQHEDNIRRRLFVFDRVGDDNMLTRKTMGEIQRTELAERVIRTAQQAPEPPRMIVLDPLSRFDGGDPNDNSDGTRLIEAAEHIRKATGATVLLPHHVSKAGHKDTDAGQEAVRGASGLVDGARWVGLLRTMSTDQAKTFGIDEEDAGRYVRFNTPKANYSAPWGGMWLERGAGGVLVPAELKASKVADKERKADAEYHELVRRIIDLLEKKGPMPKRRISEDWGGVTNTLKAGQKKVTATIHRALEEGHLVTQTTDDHKDVIAVAEGNLVGVTA